MRTILLARAKPLLTTLFVLPCLHPSRGESADVLAPETRRMLLGKADAWEVPQPKAGSRLRKIYAYSGEGDADFYILGFVEPGSPNRALVGFEQRDYFGGGELIDVPDLDGLSIDDITPTDSSGEPFGVNTGLLTGIQLLQLGNERLGVALINKSLGADSGHPHSPLYSPAGEPPVLMLARACLASAFNDIASPNPDFASIKKRIERLLADQPTLKNESTDWALEGLAANLAHEAPAEGSIESIIDDFLLDGGGEGIASWEDFTGPERRLILRGFAAVPALLAERDAKRFSNHVMRGFNNFSSYPMNAGHVIDAYLARLANREFGSNWLRRQQGYRAAEDAVLAWWKEASALGEKAYIEKYFVVHDENNRPRMSDELLLLARERYPAIVPDLYRSILKTSLPSTPVVEAFMSNPALPRARKIELLEMGIATNAGLHREPALRCLRKIDRARAAKYPRTIPQSGFESNP